MNTQRFDKWEIFHPLGEGGQGKVYLARDTEQVNPATIKQMVLRSLRLYSPTSQQEEQLNAAEELAKSILAFRKLDDLAYCGALKLLHSPKDDTRYKKQVGRLQSELKALRSLSHPNIIPILDEGLDQGWFVTEYYPQGTLSEHLKRYRGDVASALAALRPLVEAVAVMHGKNLVHRDIKPHNVFLKNGALVLGDLGLVFFADGEHSRITDTFENVGSRDWMPGWAMGLRIEEIRPSFDVFSLGKLFWSMVSGKPVLQLWYHNKPNFSLEKMFPDSPEMRWAANILNNTVVENEDNCLPNANLLLNEVDTVLNALRRHAQVIGVGVQRICNVCGLGRYSIVVDENYTHAGNFGISSAGGNYFKIFTCDRCGHVELFHIPNHVQPPAWRK